jgi:gamma-glutamyl-gamma-aminobutyrate hydrolase PuuD
MQLLNVIRGGSLYVDVRKEKGTKLPHIAGGVRYDTYRHPVDLFPGTPLRRWYRQGKIDVNSYHHQGHAFRVGLQFHPERMLPEYSGNKRIFEAFAQAVKRKARGR